MFRGECLPPVCAPRRGRLRGVSGRDILFLTNLQRQDYRQFAIWDVSGRMSSAGGNATAREINRGIPDQIVMHRLCGIASVWAGLIKSRTNSHAQTTIGVLTWRFMLRPGCAGRVLQKSRNTGADCHAPAVRNRIRVSRLK